MRTHPAQPITPLGDPTGSQLLLKCSVVFLHLRIQSENHSQKKKNLQGTNITVAKDFRQEIFGRALLSTICFVWIGLTGGGQCPVTAGARPCQLMILDAMAWLPVSVSSYVQEGLWQPPWFRVHWRQHQQV